MNPLDAAVWEGLWRRLQDERASGLASSLGRALLWPLVPLYQGASLTKRAIFSCGLFPRTRLPALTVAVGNITMGGAGKTTATRLVAGILADELGIPTAVLCRGYRSGNREAVRLVSRPGEAPLGADAVGDEAALLARWLPSCPVVLGRRRAVSGRWAVAELGVRAVVLDDGFQYWRLERDLDLVSVSAPAGFGNGFLFPRGPLREPLSFLRRASAILLHQAGAAEPRSLETLERSIEEVAPGIPRLRLEPSPQTLRAAVAGRGEGAPGGWAVPSSLRDEPVFAVCGLGSPESFFASLEGEGALVVGRLAVADHHVYSPGEVIALGRAARAAGARWVVTTEKDEANLTVLPEEGPPVVVLPVRGTMEPSDRERLVALLRRAAVASGVLP